MATRPPRNPTPPVENTEANPTAVVTAKAVAPVPPAADEIPVDDAGDTEQTALPEIAEDTDVDRVQVVLREGEYFGLGNLRFTRDVPKFVSREVADKLLTKTTSYARTRGSSAEKVHVSRFEVIGEPRSRTRRR